jgi:hypothetical protein
VPLKSATSSEVQSAWTKHIQVVPKMLHTDRGSEFVGSSFKTFLQDKKVKHYFTENYDIKACVAERFVRTLRKLFEEYRVLHNFPVQWKWSAHLPKIVKQYNDRMHSGIRSVPSDVCLKGANPTRAVRPRPEKERDILLQRKNDIATGDYVRISVYKKTFDKRGYANFTDEVFQVKEKAGSVPYYYKLADLTGETVTGKFYREELLKTTPSMCNYRKSEPKYIIDKLVKPVIRNKTRYYQLKWRGYKGIYEEPRATLMEDVPALVEAFEAQNKVIWTKRNEGWKVKIR